MIFMDYVSLEREIKSIIEDAFDINEEATRYRIFMLIQNLPEEIFESKKHGRPFHLPYDLLVEERNAAYRLLDMLGESIKRMSDEEFEEFYVNYLDILERQHRIVSEEIAEITARVEKMLEML